MKAIRNFFLVVAVLACSSSAFAENVTMTTYYPSPSGSYNGLTANVLTVTGNVLFSTGGQQFFAGISGGSLYLNPGSTSGTSGIVIASDGRIGIKKSPAANVELDVNGDIAATTVTAGTITATTSFVGGTISGTALTITPGASSLQALTATTISGTTITATSGLSSNTINPRTGSLVTINNNAQINGALTVTGTVTAQSYMHSSDERLKQDIIPVTDAVNKVKAINGVYFKYKGKDEQKMGLIAQNVEKVVPEVVATDADGMKSVDYSSLVALLIEAVKEQQVMIDELKEAVAKK